MNRLSLYTSIAFRYLKYYNKASTRYDIHSPFVFQLLEEVLEDDRQYYSFTNIERLRWRLLQCKDTIHITDFGAGSKVFSGKKREIGSIVRFAAIAPSTGQQLYKLIKLLKPNKMLELGTSLGISTAYQSFAAPDAHFISIEGCTETAAIARKNLSALDSNSVDLKVGTFKSILPEALNELGQLDYLYIDGDHRHGASLHYFNSCLSYAHSESVFVIADIHWSAEMGKAWKEMCSHPKVRLSIDYYHFGLLFFREESKVNQHFTLIPALYKPWRMGFVNSKRHLSQ